MKKYVIKKIINRFVAVISFISIGFVTNAQIEVLSNSNIKFGTGTSSESEFDIFVGNPYYKNIPRFTMNTSMYAPDYYGNISLFNSNTATNNNSVIHFTTTDNDGNYNPFGIISTKFVNRTTSNLRGDMSFNVRYEDYLNESVKIMGYGMIVRPRGASSYSYILIDNAVSSYHAAVRPAVANYGYLGTTSHYFKELNAHTIRYNTEYPQGLSDRNMKENIADITGALQTVMKLKGVSYDYKDKVFSNMPDTLSEGRVNEYKQKVKNKAKNKVGFIAQDVKEVVPSAVSQNEENGLFYFSPTTLFPYIVEAIKEQQAIIEAQDSKIKELENNIANCCNSLDTKNKSISTDIENAGGVAVGKLYQNAPNPFSNETEIRYDLPETVAKAALYIYNMQGVQLSKIELYDRNNGTVIIQGTQFQSGMYLYTLIADGKEVDTKRMILTE